MVAISMVFHKGFTTWEVFLITLINYYTQKDCLKSKTASSLYYSGSESQTLHSGGVLQTNLSVIIIQKARRYAFNKSILDVLL